MARSSSNKFMAWGEEQRQAAQAILDDPNSDQLARDLAHLQLEQNIEGFKGYGSSQTRVQEDVPEEWLRLEAYEQGLFQAGIDSEEALVALVEDPLLQNKCKNVKMKYGPDGRPSVFLAYPKLTRAVNNLLGCDDRSTRASANAVMACLTRATEQEACLKYFKKAIEIRPTDWRLRNAVASSYMSLGKVSLALEALTQAVDLTSEGSFERFEVESSRCKVLYNLQRFDEAKASFLSVAAVADQYKDQISEMDRGHLVPGEYMLCTIYAMERDKKMCKTQWDSAEAKYKSLPVHVRQRIDWDARRLAQILMGGLDPKLLSHQECHHCRKLCAVPMRCSKCKVAVYCSKECQTAAWRAGHKTQCQEAKVKRKDEKKEKKAAVKEREAFRHLPPLDATLDPYALWAKAKKLSKEIGSVDGKKKAEDAVFYFTIALFLNFSLDAQDTGPAKAAVDAYEPRDHPLALALGMITHLDRNNPICHIETNHQKAIDYMAKKTPGNVDASAKYEISESIEEINRPNFGVAMCFVFRARIMARCFQVQSVEQAQNVAYKQAFEDILDLFNQVEMYLPAERWLTFQYELGYSNLDVGASEQAKHWLELFVKNLEKVQQANKGKLTKHWKKCRKNAQAKLQQAQMVQCVQQMGVMPI